MTKFLMLFLIMVNMYGQTNLSNIDKDNYIVGGKDAKIRDFPFMVLLKISVSRGSIIECGGAYIDPHWILTAAHCVTIGKGFPSKVVSYREVLIYMGLENEDKNNSQKYFADKLVVHPTYGVEAYVYLSDIALIKVKHPFSITSYVNITKLLGSEVPSGANVTAIGWGATKTTDNSTAITRPKRLQRLDLTVSKGVKCYIAGRHKHDTICAGGPGKIPCYGDFGGPLVYEKSVVGVGSYGYGCNGDIAVYVAIYDHFFWINGMIGQGRKVQTSNACNLNVTHVIYFIIVFVYNVYV